MEPTINGKTLEQTTLDELEALMRAHRRFTAKRNRATTDRLVGIIQAEGSATHKRRGVSIGVKAIRERSNSATTYLEQLEIAWTEGRPRNFDGQLDRFLILMSKAFETSYIQSDLESELSRIITALADEL